MRLRLLVLLLLLPVLAGAQEPLRVATKLAPPFAMKDESGAWSGIAIEMFREIAAGIGREVDLIEVPLAEMIDGTADGRYDAAVAALSITPAREERVDFSYPYFTTGLGIATRAEDRAQWLSVLANFFTWQFFAVIASLCAVLMAVGFLAWIFERRSNPEEFGKGPTGILDGFWWAAVTMTTVGYGDKSPRSLGGRIVGLFWMFGAMLIVASFTGAIAASLTVGSLDNRIEGIEDLGQMRVGAIRGATGADTLAGRGIAAIAFDSVEDGLGAVSSGRIDAFVHDRPLLVWTARQSFAGEVRVLDRVVGREEYGIALPEGSALREPVNRALLALTRSEDWPLLTRRYLGQ